MKETLPFRFLYVLFYSKYHAHGNDQIHDDDEEHAEPVAFLDRIGQELEGDVVLACRHIEGTEQVVDAEVLSWLTVDLGLPAMRIVDLAEDDGSWL